MCGDYGCVCIVRDQNGPIADIHGIVARGGADPRHGPTSAPVVVCVTHDLGRLVDTWKMPRDHAADAAGKHFEPDHRLLRGYRYRCKQVEHIWFGGRIDDQIAGRHLIQCTRRGRRGFLPRQPDAPHFDFGAWVHRPDPSGYAVNLVYADASPVEIVADQIVAEIQIIVDQQKSPDAVPGQGGRNLRTGGAATDDRHLLAGKRLVACREPAGSFVVNPEWLEDGHVRLLRQQLPNKNDAFAVGDDDEFLIGIFDK